MQRVNQAIAEGKTYDPENPKCKGTAPTCEDWEPTTTPVPTTAKPTTAEPTTTPEADTTTRHNDNDCTEAMQVKPMPGDCHKYYICLPTETEGIFDITVNSKELYIPHPMETLS